MPTPLSLKNHHIHALHPLLRNRDGGLHGLETPESGFDLAGVGTLTLEVRTAVAISPSHVSVILLYQSLWNHVSHGWPTPHRLSSSSERARRTFFKLDTGIGGGGGLSLGSWTFPHLLVVIQISKEEFVYSLRPQCIASTD